jgi:murein L,D-transpeptidase YcbB/YkuD
MAVLLAASAFIVTAPQARAQVTAFSQALAQASARDEDLVAFYRARNFEGIWSGNGDRARRNALLAAFTSAGDHGLPADRYNPDALLTSGNDAGRTRAVGI